MQVNITFAKRDSDCDYCKGKIRYGQLVVGVSMLAASHRYHYLCFRRQAIAGYLETEGESPAEDWIVNIHVGGISRILFPTEDNDELYFCPADSTYWRYDEQQYRWKETIVA